MTDLLRVAVTVGTPLSLLGLVCALAYLAYARKLKFQERKLEALPAEERAARTDEYLTRYAIDGKKLKAADKLALIKDELNKRHRQSMTFGMTAAIVFVVCFALCVVAYIVVSMRPEPVSPNRGPTRLAGPAWADLTQATSYLRQNIRSFPSMQDAIEPLSELSDKSSGSFFCSDSILEDRIDVTFRLKGIPKDAPSPTVAVHVFVPRGNDASNIDVSTSSVQGGVAIIKLPGRIPMGSVFFITCSVADPMSTALDAARFEAFLE
jgi:hypothetical protein